MQKHNHHNYNENLISENSNINFNLEEENSIYENSENEKQEIKHHIPIGQLVHLVNVRFPGNAKSHPFLTGKKKFTYGQKVLALSDRGMTVGYINSFPYCKPYTEDMHPLRTISKIATDQDTEAQKKREELEIKAEKCCLELIEKLKLDMILTHVEIIHFGKKAVFYFIASERVDFRELVKTLVSSIKMRIELRQISARDRSAALGAVAPCGLQTCCSSYLQNYGNVSIKMAKNQNLTIIPSKTNGVCGQLKCCIKFEDHCYSQLRNTFPKEGSFIKTKSGDIGKITKLHLLRGWFDLLTDKGILKRFHIGQFPKKEEAFDIPKNWSFPSKFDYITNETQIIIGAPPTTTTSTDNQINLNQPQEQESDPQEDSLLTTSQSENDDENDTNENEEIEIKNNTDKDFKLNEEIATEKNNFRPKKYKFSKTKNRFNNKKNKTHFKKNHSK